MIKGKFHYNMIRQEADTQFADALQYFATIEKHLNEIKALYFDCDSTEISERIIDLAIEVSSGAQYLGYKITDAAWELHRAERIKADMEADR
jgi:hypothetical protein